MLSHQQDEKIALGRVRVRLGEHREYRKLAGAITHHRIVVVAVALPGEVFADFCQSVLRRDDPLQNPHPRGRFEFFECGGPLRGCEPEDVEQGRSGAGQRQEMTLGGDEPEDFPEDGEVDAVFLGKFKYRRTAMAVPRGTKRQVSETRLESGSPRSDRALRNAMRRSTTTRCSAMSSLTGT